MENTVKAYERIKVSTAGGFDPLARATATIYSYSDSVGTATANSFSGINCSGYRRAVVLVDVGLKAASDTIVVTAYACTAQTGTFASVATAIAGFSLAPSAAGTGNTTLFGEIDLTKMAGQFLCLKQVATIASTTCPEGVTVLLLDAIVEPVGQTATSSV